MRGFYRFIQDGEVVGESENIITTGGKILVAKYLASLISSYADAIVCGVDGTPTTSADTSLGFETIRVPILVRNVTGPDNNDIFQISFKGVIPNPVEGYIKESGLVSQTFNRYSGEYGDKVLSRFISGEGWDVASAANMSLIYEPITYDTEGNGIRIGGEGARIYSTDSGGPNITLTSTAIQGDFSGYSSGDMFALAYSGADISAGTEVSISLYTTPTSYFYATLPLPEIVPGSPTWTPNIIKFAKSIFGTSGSPSWDTITSVSIQVSTDSATTNLILDGLSLFDTDYINPDYGMTSRSVLDTPVLKTAGKTMDVEYFLEFKL